MHVRSVLLTLGFLGITTVASWNGCGGGGASNISVTGNETRDLGGFIVPTQGSSGSPDMATSSGSGSSAGNCDPLSDTGSCSGTTLTYCDPTTSTEQTLDCSSQGLVCGTDSTGVSDCIAGSTSGGGGSSGGCGSIDSNGICNGTTLEYCNTTSNTLVTKDCSASSKTCYVTSSGYAECK